jgi:hypothetical protein
VICLFKSDAQSGKATSARIAPTGVPDARCVPLEPLVHRAKEEIVSLLNRIEGWANHISGNVTD